MVKHVKPSKKELEENISKDLEELETPPEETPEEKPPVVEKEEEKEDETPEEEKETPPVEEEIKEEEEEEEKPPVVDYKKKFVESAREAQVLHSKDKKMVEALDQAKGLPSPSDEEMIKLYPDWEMLTDTEKRLAKDTEMSKRQFNILHEASTAGKDISAWNDKVDKFIDDPKTFIAHPDLEGKADDFKVFATKATRRGVDFPDLVSAFLYEVEKSMPPKHKGAMFEKGSGGAKDLEKQKGDKISLEEARNLRKTNFNKYKELLKAGKIEKEDLS